MKRILINENYTGSILKDLLSFAEKKSDKISMTRDCCGRPTYEEFIKLQTEYLNFIHEEDQKTRFNFSENIDGYRDQLYENGFTKEEAEKYFDHSLEQFLENYNLPCYEEFIIGMPERYISKSTDFLYAKFTRITPATLNPVFEVCYFSLGDTFKEILTNINELFQHPYKICDYLFEDLCFYNGERIVLAICSHENFAFMNLEDDEYVEL